MNNSLTIDDDITTIVGFDNLEVSSSASSSSSTSLPPYYKTIEYHCRAIKSSFGILDHYFIVVDNYEIHMGWYRPGKILPKNTTKNSHVVAVKKVCMYCYNKIATNLNTSEDSRLIGYYPFLNCESLSTGFSVQALAFLAIPPLVVLALRMQIFYMFLVLVGTLLFVLLYSKYMYSRTRQKTCKHLNHQQRAT